MWTTKAAVFELPVPKGGVKKNISELRQGEVFAINAKAKRFVFNRFSSTMENSNQEVVVVAHILTGSETVSGYITLPCPLHLQHEVISWGMLPNFTAKDQGQKYDMFERVVAGPNNVHGTVIDVDNQSFPDRDITVLYDQIHSGQWTGTYPAHAIRSLGERAKESIVTIAKQAQSVIRELRDSKDKRTLAVFHAKAKNEISVIAQNTLEKKERKAYRQQIDGEQQVEAKKIAQQVMSINASQFRILVDTGIITITAGEFNYEAEKAGEILGTYWDSVYQHVRAFSDSNKVCVLATQEVLNQLGSLINDGYFFIRLGYIQRLPKNGFSVHSQSSELLAKYPTKHKAVAHLRNMEMIKKQGMVIEVGEGKS